MLSIWKQRDTIYKVAMQSNTNQTIHPIWILKIYIPNAQYENDK